MVTWLGGGGGGGFVGGSGFFSLPALFILSLKEYSPVFPKRCHCTYLLLLFRNPL